MRATQQNKVGVWPIFRATQLAVRINYPMATLSPLPGYRTTYNMNQMPGSAMHQQSPGSAMHQQSPGSAMHQQSPGSAMHQNFNPSSATTNSTNMASLTALVPRVALLGHSDSVPNNQVQPQRPADPPPAANIAASPTVALHQISQNGQRVTRAIPPNYTVASRVSVAEPATPAAYLASMTPPLNIWTICGFLFLLVLLILACTSQAKATQTAHMVDRMSWRLARLENMLAVVVSSRK